jgi:hypothetical protein
MEATQIQTAGREAKGHRNVNEGRIAFLDIMRVFAFTSVLVGHKLLNGR